MRCVLIFPANFTEDAAVAANEIAEVSAGGHKLQTTARSIYGTGKFYYVDIFARMPRGGIYPHAERECGEYIMEGGLITFCMQKLRLREVFLMQQTNAAIQRQGPCLSVLFQRGV